MDLRQYLVTEWRFKVKVEIEIYILIYYLLMDYHFIKISTSRWPFEIISPMQVQVWSQYVRHDCKINLWKRKTIKQAWNHAKKKRIIKAMFSIFKLLGIIFQEVSHYALVQMKTTTFEIGSFRILKSSHIISTIYELHSSRWTSSKVRKSHSMGGHIAEVLIF